jgi:hypothetical protein
MKKLNIVTFSFFSFLLAGCATNAPVTQFSVTDNKVWDLKSAPKLNQVISTPVSDIKSLSEDVFKKSFNASRKEKFETDDAFKLRAEKTRASYGTAFIVKPLDTSKCSNYDFKTNKYILDCLAFNPTDLILSEVKSTGEKVTLSNAYTSREVEFFVSNSYSVATYTKAAVELNINSDEAKEIDKDLMVGVIISISDVILKFGGCSNAKIMIVDDKICKDIAFKSGAAYSDFKYTIEPKDILETVIYRKSNSNVLQYKKFARQ